MDCRDISAVKGCTLLLVADTRKEVLEAACQHAISVHDEPDSPRLREDLDANILETEERIPV